MRKYLLLVLFLLFAAMPAHAQVTGPAGHIRFGSSLPSVCNPSTGDVFFKTSATIGMYQCLTTNTWTAIPTSAGAGTVSTVSVVTANGFSGSVANPTTTPAITINNPTALNATTSVTIGAGSAITSSGAGGALGTAAFQNTGTSGANLPFLNGTNTWSAANGFTSLTASSTVVQTSASAAALESGPNGSTNPVLRLVNSTASQADGISITGLAAGSGTNITAISSGSNSPINLVPKGTGQVIVPVGADANTSGLLGTGTTSGLGFASGILRFMANSERGAVTSAGFATFNTGGYGISSTLSPEGSIDAGTGRIAGNITGALAASGSAGTGWFVDVGTARVSTQFDVTSSTVLANITGLSINVIAGRKYSFVAELYTSSNVAGGVQAAIAGTATATSVVYDGITLNAAAVGAQTRATALGTSVGGTTTVTAAHVTITGTIVVNVGGSLTVQFSQNASSGTASSVLVNSTFVVRDLNN